MNRLLPSLLVATASLFGTSHHATAQAPAPAKLWDITLGGSSNDLLSSLQPTSDGGYILGGTSRSGISGDKTQANMGGEDYWVVKLDATGTKLWDKTFGGTDDEQLSVMRQTSDGGYILAGTSTSSSSGDKTQVRQGLTDYWVVKLDAAGTKQWDKTFGGTNADELLDLRQTSDGGYVLGGTSSSGISGDKTQASVGAADYWVVKLDATGTKQWDKTFGGANSEQLYALHQTSDGGYILGGWSSSGISGDKTQASVGAADYWVVKLDATGTKLWDKTFGGSGSDVLRSLQPTSDGGYFLGGRSTSPISGDKTQPALSSIPTFADYWVLKIDANGIKQWDKTLGGTNDEVLYALLQTNDGGYIVGGSSISGINGDRTQPSQGGYDYWLVKLDSNGTKQWDKAVGGNNNDFLFAVHQTNDGGYILGGWSNSGSSGDKTRAPQGTDDYWVVRLGAAPLATTAATSRPALSAYPNPTRTLFTLHGPLATPYQLLNQLGQVVRAGQLTAQPLDVHTLPAGLYLLRDATSGRTTKLVKE